MSDTPATKPELRDERPAPESEAGEAPVPAPEGDEVASGLAKDYLTAATAGTDTRDRHDQESIEEAMGGTVLQSRSPLDELDGLELEDLEDDAASSALDE